jgi:hypothetical protein
VDNALATGSWTNDQTIGFVTTVLQDSALKWYNALSSRDSDNKDWEVVKPNSSNLMEHKLTQLQHVKVSQNYTKDQNQC